MINKDKFSASKGKKLIGQELVKAGIITPKQLHQVLAEQRKVGKSERELIGEIIMRRGYASEEKLMTFLEKYLGVSYVRLRREQEIELSVVKMIPEAMARKFKVVAIRLNKKTNKLVVAMANPFDVIAVDTLRLKTGYEIEKWLASARDIEDTIDRLYAEHGMQKSVHDFIDIKASEQKERPVYETHKTESELEEEADKTPVIEFVDSMMKDAVRRDASDIHIEPQEGQLSIRYRIDGFLRPTNPPPKQMESAILTRLKLIGNMDIAEQRLPQDGRFKFKFKSKEIDVRMASTPIIHGEKLVLRLLDSSSLLVKMEDLGMDREDIEAFKHTLIQPYGMILVTGPTGSGKTTTLYSALSYINTAEKNIVTIEDPVEYQLKGINQIQTKHQIGLTFVTGLRSVLRQDPDIIMIGEIRDIETLENATKASMTGHLVLSTIHTNDAPGVVFRLMHMGLEPYLISSCLSLVIAQRLVRKICEYCKEKLVLTPATIKGFEKRIKMDLGKNAFYRGKGCDRCDGTGYKGRTGLFEFLVISKKIKQLILEGTSEETLKDVARQEGMKNIFQHGIEKVNAGITTIEEVLRVTVLEKTS
jgi:type IV pilus assembly protein PilB